MLAPYSAIQNVPFSQDAEEAVIGSVLINPSVLDILAEFLKPTDFFLLRNNYIWDALLELHAQGESIDYLTTVNQLKTAGRLDNVGGEVYIIGLFRNTPSSTNAEAYARIVERAGTRRSLMNAADEIRGLAMNEHMSLEEVIAMCDNQLYAASSRHIAVRQWQFVTRDQLILMPPIQWLIPAVLPVKSLGMIFGPSGSFKSFYALDLSVDVAQKDNVLYVVAEGESGMPARLIAHEKHFHKDTSRLTFCLGAVDMFSDVELTAFKRHAARHQPSLIVVDTFAMCTGDADENNTRDMKTIVEGCKRMIKELQCSVLVVHHTNKEGKQERGNQSLRNACDTVIRVSLLDDVIRVEHQKSKDKAIPAPQYFRRVIVNLGYKDFSGQEDTSVVLLPSERVIVDAKLTEKQRQVLEVISSQPNASMGEISEITESSRNTIHSIIQRLTKSGYLAPWDGSGRNLTAMGLAVLGESSESSESSEKTMLNTPAPTPPYKTHDSGSDKHRQPSLFPPKPSTQYDRGN